MTSRLAELNAALDRDPGQIEVRYHRGATLAALGRNEEARQDFLAVIAQDPKHFGALNDLGTLLHRTDYRTAARLAYAEAVKHHPHNVIGRINLANALLGEGQAEEARFQFEAALALEPEHPDANQGMANLLQAEGDWDAAERHRQKSYRARTITSLPYRGEGAPCRVLMLVSAVGGNVPTRFVLDDTLFAVSILVVEAFADDTVLPPHDVVFNAIGDADLCRGALDAADRVLANTQARVLNRPSSVRGSGRADIASRLAGLPGVAVPKVAMLEKSDIAAAAKTIGFPLLLRSPGYHTGQHFKRVESAGALADAVSELPGRQLLLIEFLNAFDASGWARKYRVMMIGGRLFPLHLAISREWKVHYFTAAMAEQAEHRAEEAAFLADMPAVLGPTATAALEHICARLALDYAGIDFGLSPDGELLFFEANATMVINPPSPDTIWDYRRAAVDRALTAARAMVMQPDKTP
jgi:glutathione synthase/RimK-type ligase-like ATP-grasp enzyme